MWRPWSLNQVKWFPCTVLGLCLYPFPMWDRAGYGILMLCTVTTKPQQIFVQQLLLFDNPLQLERSPLPRCCNKHRKNKQSRQRRSMEMTVQQLFNAVHVHGIHLPTASSFLNLRLESPEMLTSVWYLKVTRMNLLNILERPCTAFEVQAQNIKWLSRYQHFIYVVHLGQTRPLHVQYIYYYYEGVYLHSQIYIIETTPPV